MTINETSRKALENERERVRRQKAHIAETIEHHREELAKLEQIAMSLELDDNALTSTLRVIAGEGGDF